MADWNLPRWFWIVLAMLVVLAVALVLTHSSDEDTTVKTHYPEWRAECEDRATIEVEASGGLYRVGGNHWVDLVNHCLLQKAND